MVKDEKGSIVVETMISFTLFAFLCWCILSIIILNALQTRVHYALTQTAIELSVYAYIIETLGQTDRIAQLAAGHANTQEFISNFNEVRTNVDILGGLGLMQDVATDFNLEELVKDFVGYVIVEATNESIWLFMSKYLNLRETGANTYLRSHRVLPREGAGIIGGIVGRFVDNLYIDFSGSNVLRAAPAPTPSPGSTPAPTTGASNPDRIYNTTITATYRVDFTFGILPIPENFRTLTIRQSVMTRAWTGGHGTRRRPPPLPTPTPAPIPTPSP